MTTNVPYNANAELVAMKEDIAQRKLNVKIKGILIGGALLLIGAVALAAVATVAGPEALVGALPLAKPLIYAAMAGGSAIVGLATIKELKKLEMDEQYISSYMQGKGNWGHGFRQEVLEHGYSIAGPVVSQNAPTLAQRSHGR